MFIFSIFNLSFSNSSFSTNISICSTLSHPLGGTQGRGLRFSPHNNAMLTHSLHFLPPLAPEPKAIWLPCLPPRIYSCQRPHHSHTLHVPNREHFQSHLRDFRVISMRTFATLFVHHVFLLFCLFLLLSFRRFFRFDFYVLLANLHTYTVSDITNISWWLLNLNL